MVVVDITATQLYQASLDDAMFDDACDLGQFFLNPTWYIYTKVRNLYRDLMHNQRNLRDEQAKQTTNHPSWIHLQQPLYFIFLICGWSAVFVKVYPLIRECDRLSNIHITLGYLVFGACLGSWKLASSVPPGDITQLTMRKFDNYPYDNLLYVENSICPTLNQRKLARSKYDRFTKKHVPRFDHFCGWLRQPIGEENYRHFLIFVAVHALMCGYGAVLISIIIFQDDGTTENETGGLAKFAGELFRDPFVSILMGFLGMVSVTLSTFFCFHMYIIAKGMTTNEYYKWKVIAARHETATIQYLKARYYQQGQDEEVNSDARVVDPGPMPSNLYDQQDIVKNFMEVVFPRSLYGDPYKDD